ncbi:MFS transporter [Candidatus Acetothermia bacterium]|nr:MFS transporter [Candidatus Acetothermia bacterium]
MTSIIRDRNLLLLWIGQFVSQTGDSLFAATVLFLVLTVEPTQGALKAGVVSFLETLPFLIFGLIAGSFVDRYRRRSVMLLSDAVRGALLLAVPLLWQLGLLDWIALGAVAFLLSSFSTLFNPARDALIPELVSKERLLQVNAFVQTSTQAAVILGSLLAGALLGAQQATSQTPTDVTAMVRLLVFDSITFFFSFVTILLIRIQRESRPAAAPTTSALHDARLGLRYIAQSPLLMSLLVLTAVDNFFIMGPATVGANLFIKNTLGLKAQYLAFFAGALALGWFVGTLWVSRYGIRFSKGRLLLFGVVMDGATYLPFVGFLHWDSYWLSLMLILVHGLFIPFITVTRASIIQEIVPATHLGRVFAMVNLTVVGFMALSSFSTGILGETLAPPWLFFLAGAGGAFSGLIGWGALRSLRQQP